MRLRAFPDAVRMELAIETRGLTRRFNGAHGVDGLALEVPAGAVYGFLGPNGAGKTTTIRLLLGLLAPDRGDVVLQGRPLATDRLGALAQVGALVESPSLYPHLSGRQNLEVTRRLIDAPRTRINEVLDVTGMRDSAERRVREYSLGMKQRLAISLALLGAPRLVILDEPGNGLDPAGIQDMRTLLRRLADTLGITVFVSSHQLAEVQQVASHVGVLHQGRLRFQGSLPDLLATCASPLHVRCDDPPRAAALLERAGARIDRIDADGLSAKADSCSDGDLNRVLVEAGIAVRHLARAQPSLEAFFFDVTRADVNRVDVSRAEATA